MADETLAARRMELSRRLTKINAHLEESRVHWDARIGAAMCREELIELLQGALAMERAWG
jgi:hypothetical protein